MSDPAFIEAYKGQQFGRKFNLTVFNNAYEGLDLSELRCKFSVKRVNVSTPAQAQLRIYNVEIGTALLIQQQFTSVVIQAGYESNYGTIFQGTIIQVILGREDSTTSFVDIIAADGDLAYNFSVVNTSIGGNPKPIDQLNAAVTAMQTYGVQLGYQDLGSVPTALPRGKVLYGAAKSILNTVTGANARDWTINNGFIRVIQRGKAAPNKTIVLTSKTGLVATPQQTNYGVDIKAFINPDFLPGVQVQINNAGVADLIVAPYDIRNNVNNPILGAPLNADGIYFPVVVNFQGDTRGVPWYADLICITVPPGTNPLNVEGINLF